MARWAAAIGAVALALLVAAGARGGAAALVGLRGRRGRVRARVACRSTAPARSRARCGCGSPATASRAGKPTLLYLSGGPGGAGVREFADVLFEVGRLARRYQLVSFDQRGTGSSGLIRCPALERDPRLRSTRAGAACAAQLGRAARASTAPPTPSRTSRRCGRRWACEKLTLFGDLLRHEARARLRARPPGPRRAARARLGARPRRRRRRSGSSPTARWGRRWRRCVPRAAAA